jgi:hypothetical protein
MLMDFSPAPSPDHLTGNETFVHDPDIDWSGWYFHLDQSWKTCRGGISALQPVFADRPGEDLPRCSRSRIEESLLL